MKLLVALLILAFALGVLAYMAYAWWLLGRDPDPALPKPSVLPLGEVDRESAISVDNDRRARVLSETGHLPPRLPDADEAARPIRAAEDCQ